MENKNSIVKVAEVHRGEVISYLNNKKIRIKIPRSLLNNHKEERNYVTVGDKIEISFDKKAKRYILIRRFDRFNQISRKDPFLSHISHVIASNIDYLGLVVSLKNPDINWELIDRYLITADKYEIDVLLILNKVDLLTEEEIASLPIKTYKNLDIEIKLVSAKDNFGFENLKDIIKGSVTLFSGPSGAGKSTILNLLDPTVLQKTSLVSQKDNRGRHTTRSTKLITLKDGGFIIDSPGIQDFSLDKVEIEDIKKHYIDFYPYAESCKYKNCLHVNEKICGVKDALKDNLISDLRYKNYLNIINSI
jgi:ribosome biogenesis GTPase